MNKVMGMRNILLAVSLTALLAACGSAQADSDQAVAVDAQTEITEVLDSAVTAARTYGQQHLGHYLDMDVAELRKLGLEFPANVSIKIKTDHTGYCLIAVNGGAEKSDPWRKASVKSTTQRVEAGNVCGGR